MRAAASMLGRRRLWTSLLAGALQLVDQAPGDGGVCVVRGSQQLSLPVRAGVGDGVEACWVALAVLGAGFSFSRRHGSRLTLTMPVQAAPGVRHICR